MAGADNKDETGGLERASDGRELGSVAGLIVLAATPLGNDSDASTRLRMLLSSANIIAAEDTRRLRALAARLGVAIGGTVLSNYDSNEAGRANVLVEAAAAGATVVVVSDAGMPLVSDPGFRVVQAAVAAGVRVTCAPGPSAALMALVLSGLPSDRFCFEGFWPRQVGGRRVRLAELANERRTMVFFESARRLARTLSEMAAAWGGARGAAVARELTKTHEQIKRGTLGELAAWAAAGPVLGEVTLVVAGAARLTWEAAAPTLIADVQSRVAAGQRLSVAAAEVARTHGVPRRALYDAARLTPAAEGQGLGLVPGAGAP